MRTDSKLRVDVVADTLTSRDFYQSLPKGSAQLEAQTDKSLLTIGFSFSVLHNALGKYVGEVDQGAGAAVRVRHNLNVIVRL